MEYTRAFLLSEQDSQEIEEILGDALAIDAEYRRHRLIRIKILSMTLIFVLLTCEGILIWAYLTGRLS